MKDMPTNTRGKQTGIHFLQPFSTMLQHTFALANYRSDICQDKIVDDFRSIHNKLSIHLQTFASQNGVFLYERVRLTSLGFDVKGLINLKLDKVSR